MLAPTGTIGLVMDCDTTGIEPDFALVKFKKLAGGGYFKIINQGIPSALTTLGYTDRTDRRDRRLHDRPRHPRRVPDDRSRGPATPRASPTRSSHRSRRRCRPPSTSATPSRRTWSARTFLRGLGITDDEIGDWTFDVLASSRVHATQEIETANTWACGTMTVEGAPHLADEAPAGLRLRQPLRQEAAPARSATTATS